ncbi:hypothetical protein [Desulfoluna limicola]|nr:hypothetical protein [Desulfoluna limicola]
MNDIIKRIEPTATPDCHQFDPLKKSANKAQQPIKKIPDIKKGLHPSYG